MFRMQAAETNNGRREDAPPVVSEAEFDGYCMTAPMSAGPTKR